MQPGSTSWPCLATSSCTRTLLVQTDVQWPHASHASVTLMRTGAKRSAIAKKAP